MIFCFGGWNDNPNKIQWGFLKSLGIEHVDFYDETNCWYQNKIPEILEEINRLKGPKGANRFLGVSSGGFGALLFSSITKCGPALAISPQVTLKKPEKTAKAKHKNLKLVLDGPYRDLSLLEYVPGTYAAYPVLNKNDKYHAELLKGKIDLVPINHQEHGWFRSYNKEVFRKSVLDWLETGVFNISKDPVL